MSKDFKAVPRCVSTAEFLSALQQCGALPKAKLQALLDGVGQGTVDEDASDLARRLVNEQALTPFQARRLLRGKRGLVFGRYILLDKIGEGARGRVFKARHRLMDRVVALKAVIINDAVGRRTAARFFREMKIVALLDHPNVVRAIDADEHEGCPYLVMEYLQGDDLQRVYARRGPLPADDVVAYMAQAARGLAHAHEKGVVHRDVKPTNLFLQDTGIVKVLDLGLGEFVGTAGDANSVFDTDEGVVVGTTDFMSPEQVRNRPIDARTDLFSLGCTMYQLLTGAYAFPGPTRQDRLVQRIRSRHMPITDVRPNLPEGLVRIVDRLLAIRADDRFASATEAADALDALRAPTPTPDVRPASGAAATPPALASPVKAEFELPVDWFQIESALDGGASARRTASPLDRDDSRRPSSRRLSSHRKALEEHGDESGRKVHEQYRNELIQMKQVMAELHSMEPSGETPAADRPWIEQLGEHLGDFLAEPSAGPIVMVALVIVFFLILALAYVLI